MASLSITMPTVKTHIGSIYRKTACNSKMQLSLLFSSTDHLERLSQASLFSYKETMVGHQ